MTDSRETDSTGQLTRRKVVAVGAGTVAVVGLGAAGAVNAFAEEKSAESEAEACYKLTSETVEGPYYIDAVGVYSGYEDMGNGGGGGLAPTGTPTDAPTGPPPGGGHQEPTDDTRYLRGTWKTDKHGQVTFSTVFPGWYRGRCVHIHTKVHVDGEWTDAGYEGGHACHTGQFFFDEESVLASAELEPYASNTAERTTLDEDTIYDQSGTTGGLLKLTYNKKNIAEGVIGSLTMGVDPEATNDNG
jgi:hypothetical protein